MIKAGYLSIIQKDIFRSLLEMSRGDHLPELRVSKAVDLVHLNRLLVDHLRSLAIQSHLLITSLCVLIACESNTDHYT